MPHQPTVIKKLGLAAASVLALAALLVPTSLASAARFAGSGCAFKANPYAEPAALLKSCGYRLTPLTRVRPLPGGGKEYIYVVNGLEVMERIPPAGFDPLTAPVSQLREYGLPTASQVGLKLWARLMRAVRFATPPRVLITGGPTRNNSATSIRWAGYEATGHSNFNYVQTDWTEPHISSTTCTGNVAESTWVGLGGTNTSKGFGQTGTGYGTGNPHTPWVQMWANSNDLDLNLLATFNAAAGDSMFADVTYDLTGTNEYEFFVQDITAGAGHTMDVVTGSTTDYNGGSAEVILEAPTYQGSETDLDNVGTIPFTSARMGTGTTNSNIQNLSQWNPTDITMQNGSVTNASVSGISSGTNFSISQHHCETDGDGS